MVLMDAEIGVPQWVFGQSRYAFLSGGRTVFAYNRDGLDHLAVRLPDGTVADLDLPYTSSARCRPRATGRCSSARRRPPSQPWWR